MVKHWKYQELEKLFSFVIGGDWGKDVGATDQDLIETYCIRGSELKNWRKEKGRTAALRKVSSSSLQKRKLQEGDILVEISGGGPDQPVGRTVLIDKEVLGIEPETPKVCTNFFRLVRLVDEVDKAFINYFLTFIYVSGQVVNSQGGSNNLRNLRFAEYAKIKVPLPALLEQKRIVAKLDTLFAHLDQLKTRLDKIPVLLKQFRQAVLTQAVTGKLTEEWRKSNVRHGLRSELENRALSMPSKGLKSNQSAQRIRTSAFEVNYKLPTSWIVACMADVCDKVTDGTHDTPKAATDGYRYITAQHIKDGKIDFSNSFFLSEKQHREIYKRCNPERGDVLIVNIGAGSATPAFVKTSFEFSMKNIALLKPKRDLLDGQYLEYMLLHFKKQIFETITRGGAQPFLSLNVLRTLPVILPSIEEQREIVSSVQRLFASVERIQAYHQSLREELDRLPHALLFTAFSGQLLRSVKISCKTCLAHPHLPYDPQLASGTLDNEFNASDA